MSPIATKNNGFTLIELMVAMAVAGIIAGVMYSTFEGQVRGMIAQDTSLKMTQSLRAAIEIMATDIRMAGCDPTEGAEAKIETAKADELRMTMDLGDGTGGGPDGIIETNLGEDVRYVITTNGDLGRDLNDGEGPQPLVRHCDALNFVYLTEDSDGTPEVMTTPVDADKMDEIRNIQISIVVRSADTANPGLLRSYTDNTSYKNLQGEEILSSQGDSFRRFQLSITVDPRNHL